MSCGNNSNTTLPQIKSSQDYIRILVNMDELRIFENPSIDSEQIGIAKLGSKMNYAGEMTDFSTRIKLGGVWYDEPWVSVATAKGDTAWVYGGGIMFEGEDSEELSELLLQKRMKSFFGKLTDDIIEYREQYANARTSKEFSIVFHEGEELRDRIVELLEQKIPTAEAENLPDIFWIENIFPGYVVEVVAEGTKYFLFKDFKQLYSKARQTTGDEDDIFTDLGLEVYARDSIEYFFPSWFIQTWDYGGHSLLGSGKHNDVLALADEVSQMTSLFKKDIDIFKKEILKDITHPEITYWNNQEKIMDELDSILITKYDILSKEDLVVLEARQNQFKNPSKNGIELNVRTGE